MVVINGGTGHRIQISSAVFFVFKKIMTSQTIHPTIKYLLFFFQIAEMINKYLL